MRLTTLSIILVCFLFSCLNKKNRPSQDPISIKDTSIIPNDYSALYFPDKLFLSQNSANPVKEEKLINGWYSKMLFALHEPVLYNYDDSADIFRFTWLRSFNNPISIRIRKSSDDIRLTLKVSDGTGGYEPGKIIKDTTFLVNPDEWNSFISAIKESNFWKLPTITNNSGEKDGAEWILEGKDNNQYHCVTRWSPNEMRDKDFRKACLLLVNISKINLADKEVY